MKKSWKNTIQFVLLLAIGVLLIRFSLDKLSFNDLIEQLKSGNYLICIPVFIVSATGYLFRVLRWRMMLNQMGENSRLTSLYASLCMGYTVSFVVPRLGEISRALIIKKTDNVKVDYTLLSIIAERLYDMFVLFVLAILNFILFNQLFLKLISIDQIMNLFPVFGFWFWFSMCCIEK